MRKLISTASMIALMTIPAIAEEAMPKQSAAPAEQQNMATDQATTQAAYAGQLSAADLLGKSVKTSAGENVGDINDLRIDSNGKIVAVIVGVGGFLGLGEKNVALPFDQLAFAKDADGALDVKADVTKESLQTLPEWKKPENRG